MKDINIVRKILLNRLGTYVVKTKERKLFEFVENNLMGLKAVELIKYPKFVMYFNRDGKNIFQYNLEDNDLYVNNTLIWSKFQPYFGYDYNETSEIINNVIEKVYKIKNTKIFCLELFAIDVIERLYLNQT